MNYKLKTKAVALAVAVSIPAALASCESGSSSGGETVPETKASAADTTAASAEATDNAGTTVDENGYTRYPTPADPADLSGVDFSKPDMVIGYGDFDKMTETAKQIQSYMLEGVVVDIDGVVNTGMSHSIQIPNEDGTKYIGTTFEVVGIDDQNFFPADRTRVHIKGIVRPMNEYVHIIYVSKDNFELV